MLVAERVRVRGIDDDEGQRLLRIIRRGSGSAVTWRRAQMVLLSAQGMPVAKPSSCGKYSHWMPVCSTKRIPHRAWRSGTRGRPATSFGPGSGSNGSMSDHSSSDTIHGRD
ncbi:hypothetical protein GCM10010398_69110 [Streptomyces fimbriatus]